MVGAILAVNRLGLATPVWRFDTQEPEDLTLYADALPKLAAIGLRIPEAWARDKLKIPEPEGNEPVLAARSLSAVEGPPQAVPAPAGRTNRPAMRGPDDGEDDIEEDDDPTAQAAAALKYTPVGKRSLSGAEGFPDQTAVDQGIEALATADAQNQAMAEAMLQPVMALIQNASTYQEVMSQLAEQFPDMNTTALESRLARVMFAADAWGIINSGKA
ncbi:MAG: DUF935 family protein [Methylococcus sp.]|nr:MAG: DUF935 family protein [Methylococcus sp.]